MANRAILGIDAGGTFTDFCLVEFGDTTTVRLHKTPSTPSAPEQAILSGIKALNLGALIKGGGLHIIHGSTVATNAVLERKLARTAYVTNRGFKDVLTLARQTRPSLYALEFPQIEPPVPAELCFETGGRITHEGQVLDNLSDADVQQVIEQIEEANVDAVAINLLYSFVDSRFESILYEKIQQAFPSLFISVSSNVLPVYKEYERGIATWLNSALGPIVSRYLGRLSIELEGVPLQIMQSSGDTIAAAQAASAAVNLLLSGPAGGLTALRYLGHQVDQTHFISFDMGGTSTDVALLEGNIETTREGFIASYPIGVPMVDMHTIGAGGGSIAWIDAGGALQVGPESAGAEPGPACYGKGGLNATVTDANLILGRLGPEASLAGDLTLDKGLAEIAVAALAKTLNLNVMETALGIVQIANQHMARALRLISVNRGYNPKDFSLVCFGGAGGLHVCELAELMLMDKAMVPIHGGVLSALGMLVADQGRRHSKTVNLTYSAKIDDTISNSFRSLENSAEIELKAVSKSKISIQRSAELRYAGQSFTLQVPFENLVDARMQFIEKHNKRYGYSLNEPIEIVTLQVSPKIAAEKFDLPHMKPTQDCKFSEHCEVYKSGLAVIVAREELATEQVVNGPAIIKEYAATTFVAKGWVAKPDEFGNLWLTRLVNDE